MYFLHPVTYFTQDRYTPVYIAAEEHHFEVVKVLMESGADITIADWVSNSGN